MIKIKVSKKLQIFNLPTKLKKILKKEFTVWNPIFLDNKRMGRRNHGVAKFIEIMEERNNRIFLPVGSLGYLQTFLTYKDYSFNIYDNRLEKPEKFKFKGKLKGFQSKALQTFLDYDSGTLVAPTGAGKTVMGLYCMAYRSQKTLIIVHSTELMEQWKERATEFLNITKSSIGQIGAGKQKIGKKLTIALVQSVYNRTEELSRVFGLIMVDECHRSPSRTFSEAIAGFHCKYRIGLTATPIRRDSLEKLIFWSIGPVRCTVDKKELVEKGYIMDPIFIMRETEFYTDLDAVWEYSKVLSQLTKDEARNLFIVNDIAKVYNKGDDCLLVLSDRKEHCEFLKAALYFKHKIEAEVLTGDVALPDRKKITKKIGKSSRILIATGQLIGEGFDCKNLHTLFICTPIKFSGRVIQYIGRIMRPAEGKSRPVVYDYVDWNIPVLAKSAESRINTYGKSNVKYE